MIMLTTKQILHLHNMLLAATGGLDGVRDSSLLDSAQNSAFQSFDGQELYPSVQEKICRIAFSIAKNHPFLDGNKRIAIFVMLILFKLNNFDHGYMQDILIKTGLGLADGSISYEKLISSLTKNLKTRVIE